MREAQPTDVILTVIRRGGDILKAISKRFPSKSLKRFSSKLCKDEWHTLSGGMKSKLGKRYCFFTARLVGMH